MLEYNILYVYGLYKLNPTSNKLVACVFTISTHNDSNASPRYVQ